MVKLVIVMRTDLNMRKGKMIAQGSHATLNIFFDRMLPCSSEVRENNDYLILLNRDMIEWAEGLYTKVCLQTDSESSLLELYNQAKKKQSALLSHTGCWQNRIQWGADLYLYRNRSCLCRKNR